MTIDKVKKLMSDTSKGGSYSIFNETTIARTIIDLKQMIAFIWLRREAEKGWIPYQLNFIRFIKLYSPNKFRQEIKAVLFQISYYL
jgi:hypothetical protein